MKTRTPRHEARLGLRLSREQKEKIEKAALLSGQSVSDFVTSTLLRQADAILEQHDRIVLSDGDRDHFLQLLDADEEPNEAAMAAAQRYRHGERIGANYRW